MTGAPARRLFLEQYGHIRAAEGRGSQDAAYYESLPFVPAGAPPRDPTNPTLLAAQADLLKRLAAADQAEAA